MMNIFIDLHENVTTLNKFSMFFLFLHEQIFNTTNVKGKYVIISQPIGVYSVDYFYQKDVLFQAYY
jgi:hypothetical protein